MNDTQRPDPEQLLSKIKNEETRAKRGRLKIFFGSSAGVGKTYSMLSAAHEATKQGSDVLIGYVETHGRPNTEKLLEGLRLLPPLIVPYHGMELKEFDLDAALTRKPDIVVVDELAHTNAAGCRHPKRWNDVIELLDAGISVFTTLNVQHLESLSDLVAGTTGIWVKETVPDSVFDLADDIVLVDIDSDDLLKRLHEGNVYIAPGANKRAADHFFRKENLNALREIALRRTAQRVDAEREINAEYAARLPIGEKILVCITPDVVAPKLIRAAKRMATAMKAPWTAIFVEQESPDQQRYVDNRRNIEVLERMASRLDGKVVTLSGNSVADEILSYARQNQITKIIVGKSNRFSFTNLYEGSLANKIIQQSGTIDVLVITDDGTTTGDVIKTSRLKHLRPLNYMIALLAVAGLTAPGLVMPDVLTSTDQALLYLAGIVMVAENLGFGPALFYALLAACAFNLFFIPQHAATMQEHRAYIMTFIMMLVTGTAVAKQSSKLKAQAISAREKERRTRALYEITRQLTARRGRFPVSEVISTYLSQLHDVDVSVWMTNSEGHPALVLGNMPEDTYYKDFGALQWCFENSKNAGLGTSTMPSAAGFYVPLITTGGTLGVIGVYVRTQGRILTLEETSSIETLASLLASALDRVRAGEIVAQTAVEKESKKLRESILSTFGQHFQVLSSQLSGSGSLMDVATKADLSSQGTHGQTSDFEKAISHLLDASTIEIGSLPVNKVPSSLSEHLDHALEKAGFPFANVTVIKEFPPMLPDILVDPETIERAIANVIENAARFSPAGGEVTITAERQAGELWLHIRDQGPGLPQGMEEKIFDKFCSYAHDGAVKGSGLGLTIAAGIIRLHKGRIWAENNKGKGATFHIALPLA